VKVADAIESRKFGTIDRTSMMDGVLLHLPAASVFRKVDADIQIWKNGCLLGQCKKFGCTDIQF